MKVCLVSFFYLETTLPLAKHLAEIDGNQVSVICLFPHINRKGHVVDYSHLEVKIGFDDRYFNMVFNTKLQNYLKKVRINTFFIPAIRKSPVQYINNLISLSKSIKKNNHDIVHFIGESPSILLLRILLWNHRAIHTLHEVTEHEKQDRLAFSKYLLLKLLLLKKSRIIFHSRASQERFEEFSKKSVIPKFRSEDKFHIIPFGLFETFNCYPVNENISEEDCSVLFFGRLTPYKGIGFLIGAIDHLRFKIPSLKIIIAGEGKIEFPRENNPNLEIINESLKNEDIVRLICRSKLVICPYTSASQSGIPMVSFLFGKPVIASDVGGFPEMIEHMKTGLIIPRADSKAIADSIEILLTNKELQNSIKENIAFKYKQGKLSWSNIALKTYQVYRMI